MECISKYYFHKYNCVVLLTYFNVNILSSCLFDTINGTIYYNNTKYDDNYCLSVTTKFSIVIYISIV